jgi:hypothetical protein
MQKSTNAEETVAAKDAFERWAKSCGVTIKHYHAEMGVSQKMLLWLTSPRTL